VQFSQLIQRNIDLMEFTVLLMIQVIMSLEMEKTNGLWMGTGRKGISCGWVKILPCGRISG